MFANFGSKESAFSLPIIQELRVNGISAELYPDSAKMKKQFDYANKKNIAYVVIIGESEMQSGNVSVKNMHSGNQETINIENLVSFLSNSL